MLRSINVLCCATVLVLALGQRAATAGEVQYTVTDLGSLGGTFSGAGSVNERGQVAVTSTLPGTSARRVFIWEGGTVTEIGALRIVDSILFFDGISWDDERLQWAYYLFAGLVLATFIAIPPRWPWKRRETELPVVSA